MNLSPLHRLFWQVGSLSAELPEIYPQMHIYIYIHYTYIHIYGYVCIHAYIESITMNKASGGDGIAVELFQILKDDVIKAVATGWEKLGFTLVPKKGNANNVQTMHSSHTLVK